MKRRLNLFCAIVLLVLGWSVVETGYYLAMGASMGVQAGWDYAKAEKEGTLDDARKKELEKYRNVTYISTLPHILQGKSDRLMQDSVYNARTGRYIPASYADLLVSIRTERTTAASAATGLLSVLRVVASLWALVLFIKLIVSINKSDIFNWRNVRRLRRTGLLLLVMFAASLLQEWISLQAIRRALEIPGYDLTLTDAVKGTTLLLGLCALIVGEVFAIGLKMKEEQDLTI